MSSIDTQKPNILRYIKKMDRNFKKRENMPSKIKLKL